MSTLSWNCRGSGGTTGYTLKRYLRCTKAGLAFISETRCNTKVAEKRIKDLPLCNSIVVASQGQSGGLWMIWSDDYEVTLIQKTKNFIATVVRLKGTQEKWLCCGVYGDPNRSENQAIWDRLEIIFDGFDGPACLFGDFNAIASTNEKWGGTAQLSTNNRAFRKWIHGAGLMDMGYQGPAYTWSNKKGGWDNISERLDRVLVNLQWHTKYPNSAVFHLPRFSSDHLPILLKPVASRKRRPPFQN